MPGSLTPVLACTPRTSASRSVSRTSPFTPRSLGTDAADGNPWPVPFVHDKDFGMRARLAALSAPVAACLLAVAASTPPDAQAQEAPVAPRACPSEMVAVRGFCIDRFESSLADAQSGQPLSP